MAQAMKNGSLSTPASRCLLRSFCRAGLCGLAALLSIVASAQSAPSAPTGLAASPLDGQAALSWDDPYDSTITGYSLCRAASAGGLASCTWQAISGSASTTVMHTVPSLTNGTRYYFQVRATNANGDSQPSNTVSTRLAASPSATVTIPDFSLRTALVQATGTTTITQLDMAKLTELRAQRSSIRFVNMHGQ